MDIKFEVQGVEVPEGWKQRALCREIWKWFKLIVMKGMRGRIETGEETSDRPRRPAETDTEF